MNTLRTALNACCSHLPFSNGRPATEWYVALECASGCTCGRVPDLQSGGCGFESRPGLLRTKVYSAFHPFGVGKWVPAAAGKAKAVMAHSDCGWTYDLVKICDAGKTVKSLENTCHTWALLLWWFTTKSAISSVCTLPCLYLYL